MSDKKFEKIMDMFECLHAENLYLLSVMLHLVMKNDLANKNYELISKQMEEFYDKTRKRW